MKNIGGGVSYDPKKHSDLVKRINKSVNREVNIIRDKNLKKYIEKMCINRKGHI